MHNLVEDNVKPDYDKVIVDIADYVLNTNEKNPQKLPLKSDPHANYKNIINLFISWLW